MVLDLLLWYSVVRSHFFSLVTVPFVRGHELSGIGLGTALFPDADPYFFLSSKAGTVPSLVTYVKFLGYASSPFVGV